MIIQQRANAVPDTESSHVSGYFDMFYSLCNNKREASLLFKVKEVVFDSMAELGDGFIAACTSCMCDTWTE